MKRKYLFALLVITLLIAAIFAGLILVEYTRNSKTKTERSPSVEDIKATAQTVPEAELETTAEAKKVVESEKPVIPATYLLNVPYTVQAPYRNWNIHEESCEEAAILMMHYYLTGQKMDIIPRVTANQELLKMVAWQKTNWGSEWDLDMTTLGKLANQYYGYQYEVKKNITANDIKEAISTGRPVMVPVITHGLENPNYGATPTYHILLIKGYDAKGVTTNDAGVSKGRNWYYTWNILWQAIDAQTPKMKQGRDMLTLTK
jgi:uncharacterized protein YvpB